MPSSRQSSPNRFDGLPVEYTKGQDNFPPAVDTPATSSLWSKASKKNFRRRENKRAIRAKNELPATNGSEQPLTTETSASYSASRSPPRSPAALKSLRSTIASLSKSRSRSPSRSPSILRDRSRSPITKESLKQSWPAWEAIAKLDVHQKSSRKWTVRTVLDFKDGKGPKAYDRRERFETSAEAYKLADQLLKIRFGQAHSIHIGVSPRESSSRSRGRSAKRSTSPLPQGIVKLVVAQVADLESPLWSVAALIVTAHGQKQLRSLEKYFESRDAATAFANEYLEETVGMDKYIDIEVVPSSPQDAEQPSSSGPAQIVNDYTNPEDHDDIDGDGDEYNNEDIEAGGHNRPKVAPKKSNAEEDAIERTLIGCTVYPQRINAEPDSTKYCFCIEATYFQDEEQTIENTSFDDLFAAADHANSSSVGIDMSSLPHSIKDFLIKHGMEDAVEKQVVSRVLTKELEPQFEEHEWTLVTHYVRGVQSNPVAFESLQEVVEYFPGYIGSQGFTASFTDTEQIEWDTVCAAWVESEPQLSRLMFPAIDDAAAASLYDNRTVPWQSCIPDRLARMDDPFKSLTRTPWPHRFQPPLRPQSVAKVETQLTPEQEQERRDKIEADREIYYAYHQAIKDIITQGPVTKDTQLTNLREMSRNDKDLKNRIEVTYGLVSQFVVDGSSEKLIPHIPQTDANTKEIINTNGLTFVSMFAQIDYCPAVRCELFYRDGHVQNEPLATASIEFAFTGPRQMVPGSWSLTIDPAEPKHRWLVINQRFDTNGAYAVKGLHTIEAYRHKMSPEDQDLLDYVKHFYCDPNPKEHVWIKTYQAKATRANKSDFPDDAQRAAEERRLATLPPAPDPHLLEILAHVPNTPFSFDRFVPASFNKKPYRAYHSQGGQTSVQAHQMVPPHILLRNNPPAPFTKIRTSDVFPHVIAARITLAIAVDTDYQEERLRIAALCEKQHNLRFYSFGDLVVVAVHFADHTVVNQADGTEVRLSEGTKVSLTWQSHHETGKPQSAEGVVDHLPVPLPLCDVAILISDRDNKSFGAGHLTKFDDGEEKISDGAAKPWKDCSEWTDAQKEKWIQTKPYFGTMKIKVNESVYKNQMYTLNHLTSDSCSQWHPLLLNQQPISLNTIDPLLTLGDVQDQEWQPKVDRYFDMVLQWKFKDGSSWNEKQIEALNRLRNSRGKLILVSGLAGTGKTTLQLVTALLSYALGYHVLWDAPANSNVEDFAVRLKEIIPDFEAIFGCKVDFLRIAPKSAEHTLQRAVDGKPELDPALGDFNDADVFDVLREKFRNRTKQYDESREDQLQSRVIAKAYLPADQRLPLFFSYDKRDEDDDLDLKIDPDGTMRREPLEAADRETESDPSSEPPAKPPTYEQSLDLKVSKVEGRDWTTRGDLPDGWSRKHAPATESNASHGRPFYVNDKDRTTTWDDPRFIAVKFDAWDELHKYCERAKEEPMHMWKLGAENEEDDVEARQRFRQVYRLCSKSLLGECRFVVTTSAAANSKLMRTTWAKNAQSVVIIKEEAAKDTEANFWGSIVHGNWAHIVAFVAAYGDHKQLKPIVTGSIGDYQVNPALDQLSRQPFSRLIAEGYDHTQLVQQNRLHAELADFPNRHVYSNELQTAAHRNKDLDVDVPGLKSRIRKMLVGIGMDEEDAADYKDLRAFVFEVDGKCVFNPNTQSRVVFEQIDFTMKHILPVMTEQYGEETRKKCMIISAYTETVHSLEEQLLKYMKAHNLTRAHLPDAREHAPNIHTVDSCQGREAEWVVFLSSINSIEQDGIGFQGQPSRFTVTCTRGRQVFWTVTGPLEPAPDPTKEADKENKYRQSLISKYVNEARGGRMGYWKFKQWPAFPLTQLPFRLREDHPFKCLEHIDEPEGEDQGFAPNKAWGPDDNSTTLAETEATPAETNATLMEEQKAKAAEAEGEEARKEKEWEEINKQVPTESGGDWADKVVQSDASANSTW